jgi:hypothetical protein
MPEYHHWCRDDHVEIGHRDTEYEQCPLCRAIAGLEDAVDTLEAMDLHVDNPLYMRLTAILDQLR